MKDWLRKTVIIPAWLFYAMVVVIIANAIAQGVELFNG